MKHFTAREVAKVLEVTEAQLKAYLRMVPVAPRRNPQGEIELSFQDLLLLKTTHGLVRSGVPASRIRRTWSSLQGQLDRDLPLTSFKLAAEGHHVVASDGESRWEPDSGQIVLELGDAIAIAELPVNAEAIAESAVAAPTLTLVVPEGDELDDDADHDDTALAAPNEPDRSAEEWFELALELDAAPDEARVAYERALALDPTYADAHLNLGRHYHDVKELGKAEAHYREAVRHAPEDATAHFNLGVLLEDRGRKEEAILAYRQAIVRDAEYADAHYNLGLLLESLGRRTQAMTHLMTARTLYGGDESES